MRFGKICALARNQNTSNVRLSVRAAEVSNANGKTRKAIFTSVHVPDLKSFQVLLIASQATQLACLMEYPLANRKKNTARTTTPE